MISKKKIFLKKIDLLIISLEVLNNHYINDYKINKFKGLRSSLKSHKWNKKHDLIKLIKYVQIIRLITKKYLLHEIAKKILKSRKTSFTIYQYVRKFNNTQAIKKIYYKTNKLLYSTYDIDMNFIAVINLYMISQLINKNGTSILFYYLLNEYN